MRTNFRRARCLALLGIASLWPTATAQAPVAPSLPTCAAAAPIDITGELEPFVGWRDGELIGAGHDYRTLATAQGFEFTPALGERFARTWPVNFRLAAIGRGEQLEPVCSASPRLQDNAVVYDRGSCEERYELRWGGVEQSFVFGELPRGSGDLVVELLLASDLKPNGKPGGGIALREPEGLGGIHIGGVTGIDARSRRVTGHLELLGDRLRLSLPAAFVDGAALPLVLDPFITSNIDVALGYQDSIWPDVAYDLSNDTFLVTFERAFSIVDHDIWAARVTGSGVVTGALIVVQSSNQNEYRSAVANVNASNLFVVVYQRNWDVFARGVTPAGGVLNEVTIASGNDQQSWPDVGGELVTSYADAICVWLNETTNSLELRRIRTTSSGLTPQPPIAVHPTSVGNITIPRIADSGGSTGRYLITYMAGSPSQIHGTVIDRNLSVLRSNTVLAVPPGIDSYYGAKVDGDGHDWVVAWGWRSTGPPPAYPIYRDVMVQGFAWNPGTQNLAVTSSSPRLLAGTIQTEDSPAVAWVGSSSLAMYRYYPPGSPAGQTFAALLDPFPCNTCEGPHALDTDNVVDGDNAVSGTAAGGGSDEKALAVWISSHLRGRLWRSDDGALSNLAAACGQGGDLTASCARIGYTDFRLQLRGARPSSTGFAVISPQRTNLTCGSCVLVADPFSGLLLTAMTTSAGTSSLALPIPSASALSGLLFYAQWLVAGGSACSTLGFEFSNGVSIRIN